jgi:hypothetical protein
MDYYLKTTSKEDFLKDLNQIGIDIQFDNNYYQDMDIIIEWIGLIPNPIQTDENGNLIGEVTYRDGEHINIRSVNPIDISLFKNTVSVYPQIPYRMFS